MAIAELDAPPDRTRLPDHVAEAAAAAAGVDPAVLSEAVRLVLAGGLEHEARDWQQYAACRGDGVDDFYPARSTRAYKALVARCHECPVQDACLATALAAGERVGLWGGTTAVGRTRLRIVLRRAGILGVVGEEAYLAWLDDGADREPPARSQLVPVVLEPRPHQRDAVAAVCAAIADGGPCQIAMATASGKTHVGLWVAERLGARRTLVLVPNLALVAQTSELWAAGADSSLEMLAVCSDTGELALEATTDPGVVRHFLEHADGPAVVFATYQSSSVLTAAGVPFDLTIADEAHHLAGEVDKHFAAVVRGEIPTARTLYMTATPKRFHRRRGDVELIGMDDPAFGPRVYDLNLSDAVAAGIVADYRVIVAAVDRATFERVARHPQLGDVDPHLLAGAIAVVRAMGDADLRSCVSFHTRVERARTFASLVGIVAEALPGATPPGPGWSGFLHGGASMRIRRRLLARLVDDVTWGVVANAKTLGEGVDVPTLDSIAIVDPKTSESDVMQAVGRALRRPGKSAKIGTVLLPVLLSGDADPEDPLAGVDERSIEIVSSVLRALRAHDAELGSRLDRTRRRVGHPGHRVAQPLLGSLLRGRAARGLLQSRVELWVPGGATGELAGALSLRLIRESTAGWEEALGRLEAWVLQHGSPRVPQGGKVPDETGTFSLGAWCTVQRTLRRRGLLAPDRVAKLEAIDGWRWDPRDEQWWEKFEALKEYVERHGRIPARSVGDNWRGLNVGSFVNISRTAYTEGGKDREWIRQFPDRVAALESLPGWAWNQREADWNEHFAQLERWVQLTGSADPHQGDLVDGFDIGRWLNKQRSALIACRLEPDRLARLRSLPGWVDDFRSALWEDGFTRLTAWADANGGTLPPQQLKLGDGFTLGAWVATQRERRRQQKLSVERTQRLEALPYWSWEPTEEAWERAFEVLVRYVAANPRQILRVPVDRVEDVNLGAWIGWQRRLYAEGAIAPERVARLEAIPGWAWDLADAKFEAGLAAVAAFLAREGHCDPASNHREGEVSLYVWINYRRKLHAAGGLPADQVERLEELDGWTWQRPVTVVESWDRAWEANFERFRAYVEETGDACPDQRVVLEDGHRLGGWVNKQRRKYGDGQLPAERVRRLEALPGFEWGRAAILARLFGDEQETA